MQCPRLDHFVRINYNGTVSRCGHMVNAPQFSSFNEMENSEWLYDIRQSIWPNECIRCRQTESLGEDSIRVHSIRYHQKQRKKDYRKGWKEFSHVYTSQPMEVRARLGEIRFHAKKEGIYDPFTEKPTKEHFQEYINKIGRAHV